MEIAPGQTYDRYLVEAQLGAGGMATVFRVRHTTLDTMHALKVLLVPARTMMDRLIQEGRAQAQLRHPNIVAVTDVIDVAGAPGLVMELINGPSLHELIRTRPLTLEQADALGRDVIRGVAHAHERGMIHRDLKPANVMLQIAGGEITAKVTDFGLAKLLHLPGAGAEQTASGLAMGTPAYMAPEQYRDAKNVDERADVFSLGAILYEMVTGRRAFAGDDMMQVYIKVNRGDYEDPRTLVPGLPARMADAIDGALEIDPADRWQSCTELLQAWCGSTMTSARRSSVHSGTWSAEILDAAAKPPAPTLEPRADDVGSSETLYESEAGSDSFEAIRSQGPVPSTRPPSLPPAPGPSQGSDSSPPSAPPSVAPSPQLTAPTLVPSSGGGFGLPVVIGALVLGLSLPVVLVIGYLLGAGVGGETTDPVADAASDPPAPAPVEVAPEPEPAPVPEPAAPQPKPQPTPAPSPRGGPAPAPAPSPAPAPAAANTGIVEHRGDGRIELVSAAGRWPPGPVPAGTYDVIATFPDKAPSKKGSVVVPAGATVVVKCDARFNGCRTN